MRRLVLLLSLLLVLAPACSGGGGDDDGEAEPTTPSPAPATTATTEAAPTVEEPAELFSAAQLPKLALQPADAPPGMRYTKVESGKRTLEEVGIVLDRQVKEVEKLDLLGIYDAIFDSTRKDLRVSTRVWLFGSAANAEQWLDKTRSDLILFQFEAVDAPQIGDSSWAARGNAGGPEVVSHGFRAGNAVVVVTLSSQTELPDETLALEAARRAEQRIASV